MRCLIAHALCTTAAATTNARATAAHQLQLELELQLQLQPTALWIEKFQRRQAGQPSPRRSPGEAPTATRPARRQSAVQRLKSNISNDFSDVIAGIGGELGDFNFVFNNNAL
jgi:hypothetical protein